MERINKILVHAVVLGLLLAGCGEAGKDASDPSPLSSAQLASAQLEDAPSASSASSQPLQAEDGSADEQPHDSQTADSPENRPGEYVEMEPGGETIYRPIEPGGADYRFEFSYTAAFYRHFSTTGGRETVHEIDREADVTVRCYGPDNALIQEISYQAFSSIPNPYSEWSVQDVNFDGYQDIYCQISVGGSRANQFYSAWLWNPESEQFEKADIDGIYNPSIHPDDRTLRSYSSGGIGTSYEIYRFQDGQFQLTNELMIGSDQFLYDADGKPLHPYLQFSRNPYREERYVVIEKALRDGEMLPVMQDVDCSTQQGQQLLWEHLRGPDSLWLEETAFLEDLAQ